MREAQQQLAGAEAAAAEAAAEAAAAAAARKAHREEIAQLSAEAAVRDAAVAARGSWRVNARSAQVRAIRPQLSMHALNSLLDDLVKPPAFVRSPFLRLRGRGLSPQRTLQALAMVRRRPAAAPTVAPRKLSRGSSRALQRAPALSAPTLIPFRRALTGARAGAATAAPSPLRAGGFRGRQGRLEAAPSSSAAGRRRGDSSRRRFPRAAEVPATLRRRGFALPPPPSRVERRGARAAGACRISSRLRGPSFPSRSSP